MTARLIQYLVLVAIVNVSGRTALAQDFTVAAGGECPGRVTIRWEGAYPNHHLAVCVGLDLGSTTLPAGPCCGTVMGIRGSLQLVHLIRSGPLGQGRASGQADPTLCGRYLQLIAYTGAYDCPVSNVVQLP